MVKGIFNGSLEKHSIFDIASLMQVNVYLAEITDYFNVIELAEI